ncbi:Uncharacterized protein FKW44_005001, partial [Caligus rogercresseyi]
SHLRCAISESVCKLSCYLAGQKTGACIPNEAGGSQCICIQDQFETNICDIEDDETSGYKCAAYCQIRGRRTGWYSWSLLKGYKQLNFMTVHRF